MLYLEDYLEMIENLPMEMKDRFTEMREMDLQVQNNIDNVEDQLKIFFGKCGNPILCPRKEIKDHEYNSIKKKYHKALDDANEKVHMANSIYELVERHLRKLDQEVSKFKMELEADHAGITETLEKRSLELDVPPMNNYKHERKKHNNHSSHTMPVTKKRKYNQNTSHAHHYTTEANNTVPAKRHLVSMDNKQMITHASNNSQTNSLLNYKQLNARLQEQSSNHKTEMASRDTTQSPVSMQRASANTSPAGSNAHIAAAASRAIGATLEMQQGRRTASLKASFEASRGGVDSFSGQSRSDANTATPSSSVNNLSSGTSGSSLALQSSSVASANSSMSQHHSQTSALQPHQTSSMPASSSLTSAQLLLQHQLQQQQQQQQHQHQQQLLQHQHKQHSNLQSQLHQQQQLHLQHHQHHKLPQSSSSSSSVLTETPTKDNSRTATTPVSAKRTKKITARAQAAAEAKANTMKAHQASQHAAAQAAAQAASQLALQQSQTVDIISTDQPTKGADAFTDPNEPRYCTCNDISYGDMVGCDNADCTIEWFHYACVGLTTDPKGKWYCPQCTASMKRRSRKN